MSGVSFREAASNAVRFWEKARVAYNLALAAVVIGYFVAGLPSSARHVTVDAAATIFLLAVMANVFFCAAYLIDIFVQFTSFNAIWLWVRWIVLAIGVLFASVITRFVAMEMFPGAT